MARKESGITLSKSDWGKGNRRIAYGQFKYRNDGLKSQIVTSNQRRVLSSRQRYVLTEAGRKLIKDCAFK